MFVKNCKRHCFGAPHYQGVGLKNVYERLRVYYGEEADVVIESEPDVGTKVTLVIPLKGALQNEGK